MAVALMLAAVAFSAPAAAHAEGGLVDQLVDTVDESLGDTTAAVDDVLDTTSGVTSSVDDALDGLTDTDDGSSAVDDFGEAIDGVLHNDPGDDEDSVLRGGMKDTLNDLVLIEFIELAGNLLDEAAGIDIETLDSFTQLVELLASGVAGEEGLDLLQRFDLCATNCDDYRAVGVEATLKEGAAVGVSPQVDAEVCLPGPCGADAPEALASADVNTSGSERLPSTTTQLCAGGECETDGLSGSGMLVGYVDAEQNNLFPGVHADFCVLADCADGEYAASGVMAANLRVTPLEQVTLVGYSDLAICLIATCVSEERYRSGLLTVDLTSGDEHSTITLAGRVCLVAVCELADAVDGPPGNGNDSPPSDNGSPSPDNGGPVGPETGTTGDPDGVPSPETGGPADPGRPGAPGLPDGLIAQPPTLPNAGVPPHAGDAGGADFADAWGVRLLLAVLGLSVVALLWRAGLRAARRPE